MLIKQYSIFPRRRVRIVCLPEERFGTWLELHLMQGLFLKLGHKTKITSNHVTLEGTMLFAPLMGDRSLLLYLSLR